MPLLYRAYSDASHGINRQDIIAPAAAQKHAPVSTYRAPPWRPNAQTKSLLEAALLWKDVHENPFCFLTSSLLFAIQIALYQRAKGETNISIAAIDTSTAKRPDDGMPITFRPVPDMMRECGLVLRNSNGSLKEYEEVFVVMDAIALGHGCRIASLEAMIDSGLYPLHPPFSHTERNTARAQQRGRHDKPRIHLAVDDMRKYGFDSVQPMSKDQITLAAKVASCFVSLSKPEKDEKMSNGILGALLGFQKRRQSDAALSQWLRQYCDPYVDLADEDAFHTTLSFSSMKLPEVAQAHALHETLRGWQIPRCILELPCNGPKNALEQEYSIWKSWWFTNKKDSGEEWRSKRQEYGETSTGSRKRRRESEDVDMGREYKRGRECRPWLPRPVYEAQRAERGFRRWGSNKRQQRS